VASYAEIYEALTSGRAHLAAAALKVPAKPIPGVEFGPIYQRVKEHLVYRRGGVRPGSLADIGNSDLEIAAGSAHAKNLRAARDALPNLAWVENASTDSQSLLDGVADGSIDYTIADSTEFALAHDAHPDLRIAFDFPGSQSLAWAASSRDPGFLDDMNVYFSQLNTAGELAAIVKRYYGRSEDLQFAGDRGFLKHLQSRLPLYKKWFVEAAAQSSQDWRLLAAIGYQESKWNPGASSASGAKGLMQLTVDGAMAANVTDLGDARQSIFGGARYFRQVYSKIPTHIPEPDRTWFALAAYNIGYGHLEDARVLAQKAGRDPDSWQDVREFLPLLEQEFWYTQTENGYARGSEPVRYVDNVRDYRDMLEWAWGSSGASLN
jgi:membrane-bound lytic murein transglycosylase F